MGSARVALVWVLGASLSCSRSQPLQRNPVVASVPRPAARVSDAGAITAPAPTLAPCVPGPSRTMAARSPHAGVANLHRLWSRTLSTGPLVLDGAMLAVNRHRLERIDAATGGRRDLGAAPVDDVATGCFGGDLVVADGAYRAVGIDAATGARRVDVRLAEGLPFVGCAVGPDAAFVVQGRNGPGLETLIALRKTDGSERWRTALPPGHSRRRSAPIRQVGDLVYLPADTEDRRVRLLAFDAATGAPRWSADASDLASFAFDAERVVVGDADGLRILDPATGGLRRRIELAGMAVYGLSMDGDQVTAYGKLQASGDGSQPDAIVVVDVAGCSIDSRWVDDHSCAGVSDLVVIDGVVYINTGNGVAVIDHGALVERWSTGVYSSIASAGHVLVSVADRSDYRAGVIVGAFVASGPPIPEEDAVIEGRVLAVRCGSIAGLTIDVGDASTTTDARGRYRLSVTGRGTFSVGGGYDTYPTLAAFRDPENIRTPILVTLSGARRYHADLAINLCHGD